MMRAFLSLFAAATLATAVPAGAGVDARMLRQPDVSATEIAFVYAGDIWVVPKTGGEAHRLSTPPGEESFPRFSPDGREIAFSGDYDGNVDIYVLPAEGGLPRRLTHHPSEDRVLDWYPDGGSILFASQMSSPRDRFSMLYRTSPEGGLPEKLPPPYGEFGAVGPDGKTLAYLPLARDHRTWKRYRGGMASEIWLFDLEDYSSRNLTQNDANDSQPMWHGDTLYFVSDRDENKRWNIWALSLADGSTRQVTHFTTHDVHYPAIGPEDVVLECAGRLYRLDLATEELHEVEVEVVTDLASRKPRHVEVGEAILSAAVSPSGRRAVVSARGEIFTLPAEHGAVRQLTRTSGFAERTPAWSPDGRDIAYWSDRSGEYELTVRPADGSGGERTLTSLGPGFRYQPFYSPDSKKIAFIDEAMRIRYYDTETENVVDVDRAVFATQGALRNFRVSWSSDSRWLAYDRNLEEGTTVVFLFDTSNGALHQVTDGFYTASRPAFDPGGGYLYVRWDRDMNLYQSDLQSTWIYANVTQIAAIALRADVDSPLRTRNDVEEPDGDDGEQEGKKDKEGKEDEKGKDEGPKAVEIDLEGFESRLVVLPPESGNYSHLEAAEGKVVYIRRPRTGSPEDARSAGGTLVYYDLKEREEQTVLEKVNDFRLSHDGQKALVSSGGKLAIIDLKPGQKMEKTLATSSLTTLLDPPAEWRQIFNDAWRFERDYFYDAGLHGVDWEAMRERYGSLLDDVVTRWDLNYVIGELIGELNASHAYRGGGDTEQPLRRGVGLLGVDFTLENGAYRIHDVIDVAPWESEVRSPLAEPGLDAGEGDYLLAVDGLEIDVSKDPWAAFEGLAEQTVTLTVNDKPTLEGAHEVVVKTLASEERLRYLAWVEENRRRVEEASGGRIGYIYVPDTSVDGQTELVRQFLPQVRRDGLIVDERWNSGGQVPDRFIELLNRPRLNYWGLRYPPDVPSPFAGHDGPKAMLINGWSGSGGDLFPYYFRLTGLGPLIGRRTWGGLIGVSGSPPLIDGGGVTVPSFGLYSLDGEWVVEGHGVEPDIEVVDDPTAMARGGDPQLERAVEEVLRQLEENPPVKTPRPPSADRSGT